MGFANKTHWLGVFLLFAASILLLITTISAPVINKIGLLHVTLRNGGTTFQHDSLSLGTFGWCFLDPADSINKCTKSHIGYNAAHIIAHFTGSPVEEIAAGTSDALTNVMVLHPIECGIAFIAFLLSCGAGIVGSFVGALVALVAWILTLISLAVDFSLFGILHHHVNSDSNGSAHASFGTGIWTLLAAFVCLFFGMIIVFFTCCANRREKRSARASKVERHDSPPRRRKRFGLF